MPSEPLRAHLLTRGAYYRGALHYADAPGTARPRLLDFLNARARGRGAIDQRSTPVLRLDGAELTVYQGASRVVVQASIVTVAMNAVVVAFDESPVRQSTAPPPATAAYEARMALEKEPVVVLTRTRHRLNGFVRGGLKRLSIRSADEPFIAVTDVTIEDLSADGRAPATLPFVAMNMEFVEAFWTP
jgi:hypothetical protein